MNKFILIIWMTGFFTINLFSQEKQLNELKAKLQSASPKEKVSLYLKLSGIAESYKDRVGYCERAINIANELKDVELQANANFALGIYHYSEGKYSNANKTFVEALSYYNKRNDSKAVAKTYYWLAMSNKYWGKYQNAEKYGQQGLELNERLKYKDGIIESCIVLGSVYNVLRKFNQAQFYFNRALKESGIQAENANLAFIFLGKGDVCLELGKLDSAKIMYEKSNKIFEKLHNKFGEASSLKDYTKYYIAKKDYKKAESVINQSIKELKEINNNRILFDAYLLKGDIYFKKGNYAKAVELYLSALKIAEEMEIEHELLQNYRLISKTYELRKDNQKALKYYKLYISLNDSVGNAITQEQLTDLKAKYENEKAEKENLMHKGYKSIKQSSLISNIIIILLALWAISVTILFYLLIKKTRKTDEDTFQTLEQNKNQIEFYRNQISAELNYALKIQNAMFPDTSVLNGITKGHFVLLKPRTEVGGDFYWIRKVDNTIVIAVADCTGNGAEGALMSILGMSLLSDLVENRKMTSASEILEEMRKAIKIGLKQELADDTTKDSIEMSICIINTDTLLLDFAGANLPLYHIRKGNLEIYKGTNNPLGAYLREKPFESKKLQLMSNDKIYLFTNGYMDQFGGKSGSKFKVTHFRDALLAVCETDMASQKQILDSIFEEWKNSKYEQTDDVLVFGLKI